MRDIRDFVMWIARSMHMELDEDKVNKIAQKLVKREKYKEMLQELEEMIMDEKKTKWRRK